MRSLKMAQNILESVFREAETQSIQPIKGIRVEMSPRDYEDYQALKLCFEALSVGTIAEGARLDIKRIGIYAKCTRCGLTFRSQNVRLMCPDCGERRVQLLDGEGHPTIVVSLG